MGVRGLPPRKLISFDPFVNGMMVIVVNFLDFVNFLFLLFSQFFFRSAFFLGGGGCAAPHAPPAYAPEPNTYITFHFQAVILKTLFLINHFQPMLAVNSSFASLSNGTAI